MTGPRMRWRGLRHAPWLCVLASPLNGVAQIPSPEPTPRVVEVRAEPARPAFGEVFRLWVTLRIPAGHLVFLGDTLLPSDAVESVAPARWRALAGPGDSLDVEAAHAVLGFREGSVELPRVEVWLRRDPDRLTPATDRLRPVGELGSDPTARAQRHLVRLGTASLVPLLPPGDSTVDTPLRPPADVLGSDWNAWLVAAAALLALGIVAVARWLRGREWERDPPGPQTAHAPTGREALEELDRILAEGWHASGRTPDFYRASTEVLRGFAHRADPAWGPWLTSHELLRSIEASAHPGVLPRLRAAVSTAENVKFGRLRPPEEDARRDWQAIRDWIEARND